MNTGPRRNQTRRTGVNDKAPHLLLRAPNFVANPGDLEASPAPLACEASALTAELTARNRSILVGKSGFVNRHLLPRQTSARTLRLCSTEINSAA